jgi:hypothetical protein
MLEVIPAQEVQAELVRLEIAVVVVMNGGTAVQEAMVHVVPMEVVEVEALQEMQQQVLVELAEIVRALLEQEVVLGLVV